MDSGPLAAPRFWSKSRPVMSFEPRFLVFPRRFAFALFAFALALCLIAAESRAQTADGPIAPDSPRAAIEEFTRLTQSNEYKKAARYLDLSGVDQADGPVLAKHLREVLDRHL